MTYCTVILCHNASEKRRKISGISFHRFPSDPIKALQWIKIIRRCRNEECWRPHKNTRICSIHFEDKYLYSTNTGQRRLHLDAVPTKNLPMICPSQVNISENGNFAEIPIMERQLDSSSANTSIICIPDISIVKKEVEEPGTSTAGLYPDHHLESGCPSHSSLSDIDSDDLEGALETPLVEQLKQQLKDMKKQLQLKDQQIKTLSEANSLLKVKFKKMKLIIAKMKNKFIEINSSNKKSSSKEDSNKDDSASTNDTNMDVK